jgi:uncharacterized membrane protein YedE/YeeE
MRTKVAGGLIGIVFGVILSWCWMSDPDVVQNALTFDDFYMFKFFALAVGTGALGLHLVKRYQRRALLTDTEIGWTEEKPQRRHFTGAAMFGVGWGITGACPGPIATQLGQGVPWAIVILIGAVGGVYLFLRRGDKELEPASDQAPARAAPQPA